MPQAETQKDVVQRPQEQHSPKIKEGINYLFVIAIDAYEYCPRLFNCVADARKLIQVLTKQYFFEEDNVLTLFNEEATEGNIFKSFRQLAESVTKRDNLIIYFSGMANMIKYSMRAIGFL